MASQVSRALEMRKKAEAAAKAARDAAKRQATAQQIMAQRALMAGKPCGSKSAPGILQKDGRCLVKARPGMRVGQQPGFTPPGLRGRGIATPGGQMVTPSVVAANCGAGQAMKDGVCQAVPGSSISPTTGTIAQPNQGATGPVTYSQWTPPPGTSIQTTVGPSPDEIESTPAEDEKGTPVAPAQAQAGMSTGAKVGMAVGGVVVGFLVLKALGVFKA